MALLTYELVQRHRKVKSSDSAPEVDEHWPMIKISYDAFH